MIDKNRSRALVIVCLGSLMIVLDVTIVGVALPRTSWPDSARPDQGAALDFKNNSPGATGRVRRLQCAGSGRFPTGCSRSASDPVRSLTVEVVPACAGRGGVS
jgi:hypothetical protein